MYRIYSVTRRIKDEFLVSIFFKRLKCISVIGVQNIQFRAEEDVIENKSKRLINKINKQTKKQTTHRSYIENIH